MQVDPITALPALSTASRGVREAPSFADAMGSAADELSNALSHADTLAAAVAGGNGGVAEAAIARAKADVMLEVAAVAASRVSGTISTLLQTQM